MKNKYILGILVYSKLVYWCEILQEIIILKILRIGISDLERMV